MLLDLSTVGGQQVRDLMAQLLPFARRGRRVRGGHARRRRACRRRAPPGSRARPVGPAERGYGPTAVRCSKQHLARARCVRRISESAVAASSKRPPAARDHGRRSPDLARTVRAAQDPCARGDLDLSDRRRR